MQRRSRKSSSQSGLIASLCLAIAALLLVLGFLGKQVFFEQAEPQTIAQQPSVSQTGEATSTSRQEVSSTWIKQQEPVKIPILMYHAIHDMAPEEAPNANLIVAPDVFESHVKALKEAGYHFLTPAEAYRALTENALPANKVVWLTFDDSLWDFHDVAYPILQKYGATATNNVITGLTQEQQAGHLTEAQLLEMQAAGMTFEGHTVTHPDLSATGVDGQIAELTDSKTYLDQLLHQETTTIVYPAGRYNEDTLAVASQAGYKLGLTTNEGLASLSNGLLTLNRVRILPTTTADALLSYISTE
ncbi:polysaccharide deacetylase family protein [Streptococcus entericus]|uniref:polysaccharide deacetylase family protein n=1 Tax=Streptococcus entericus TaxID=155680 RepID=UPI000377222C|nr:polysaccharide deacetylase family protein [Streptococcus entericus]